MNDFTKEELQYFLDRIDTTWKHEMELYKKVKSMIDNPRVPTWKFNNESVTSIRCKTCSQIVKSD